MSDLLALKKIAKKFSVLYVEDEIALRRGIEKYLQKFFMHVDTAKDGKEGLELYNKKNYDLVITDIKMPKLNGLDLSSHIKKINENQNILIVSAYSDISSFTRSIKIGIDGYILKPIDYNQLNSTLYKIVYKIKQFRENEEYKSNLEKLVKEKTKQTKKLQNEKVKNYQKKTLFALVKMIEGRDSYTGNHSQRVAQYSQMIAKKLGLDDKICEDIYQAGILHDIGKVIIPDTILLKPSSLNKIEYDLIKKHVSIGVEILRKIPMFKVLASYINSHHERYDGSGYPSGLKGDEILLESQIMAISDVFDAMTTSRIYKLRMSTDKAIKEIQNLRNIHFRSDVVDAAIEVFSKVSIDKNINQMPLNKLEQERFSYFYKDQVTQIYNANYLDLILIKNSYDIKYRYIHMISVHNLNSFNIKYGWLEGNKYLKNVAQNLQKMFDEILLFRIYGDDFLILSAKELKLDKYALKAFIKKAKITFETTKYDIVKHKIFSLHDFKKL